MLCCKNPKFSSLGSCRGHVPELDWLNFQVCLMGILEFWRKSSTQPRSETQLKYLSYFQSYEQKKINNKYLPCWNINTYILTAHIEPCEQKKVHSSQKRLSSGSSIWSQNEYSVFRKLEVVQNKFVQHLGLST